MTAKPLNTFNSQTVLTLTRLATELADRFKRLAPGEDGNIDPDDKKLLDTVRKQIQKVQSEPMREMMKPEKKKGNGEQMTAEQWNAKTEDEKFDALRTIGFSQHDAGVMRFHAWEKLPRFVHKMLEENKTVVPVNRRGATSKIKRKD